MSASTASRSAVPAASLQPEPPWALWLALALVAGWVALGALTSSGQWGDHFEQFVWAHGVEWGYHKHPPLPTWMLAAVIRVFGPWPYWTYVLAGLCTAGTAFFTYRIALRLLGAPTAAFALLLWGLQQAFSMRAQLFNHNTVMMLAVGATAWCALRALDSGRLAWWVGAGVGAGLGLLAKYQSIVPLAGIVVAALLTGAAGKTERRRTLAGLGLAVVAAALVFSPHVVWLQQHAFSTLRYASQESQSLDWAGRGKSVTSFLVQQVRLLLPSLLFALLLWLLPGRRRGAEPPVGRGIDDAAEARWRRAWFIGLIAFPLVATVLTCPVLGLKLQNHWGYQCLQFVSLWLAWRLRPLARRSGMVLALLALSVHAVSMTVTAQPSWTHGPDPGRRIDGQYPARRLAAAVQRDWAAVTPCPLSIVVGPTFEAGMVSVYARQHEPPKVLENGDFTKSPWVRPEELLQRGAAYVATDQGQLPKDAARFGALALRQSAGGAPEGRVYWAIVPPVACTGNAERRRSMRTERPGTHTVGLVNVYPHA